MSEPLADPSLGAIVFRKKGLVLACTAAGVLAVPAGVVATPLSGATFGLLSVLGLYVWRWSRLPSSFMAGASATGRPWQCAAAMGIGLVVGLVLLGLLRLVIEPAVPAIGARIAAAGLLPLWRRAAIIFVAAVSEELIFRLLLLSVVAGLTTRLLRVSNSALSGAVNWWSIGIAALAFAAIHLPSWSGAVPMSAGLILSVLALNALGGIAFGYVFVMRGIVPAMFMHAGADCAIQLVGPLTR